MAKIKVFEAFAGIGTQSLGLKKAGIDFETVAIAEIDGMAYKAYQAIHGETLNLGDISKVDATDIPDHDLFTYSFPCQDLSISGKHGGIAEGSGTRSSLLWECMKVIEGKKPKYLLLENVPTLASDKFKEDFDKWLTWLEGQGYSNYWKVVNAADYVPQQRKRLFVVSILNDEAKTFTFPKAEQRETTLLDYLEDIDTSHVLEVFKDSEVKSLAHGGVNFYNTNSNYYTELEKPRNKYVGYIGNNFKQATRVLKPVESVTLMANGGGQGGKTGLYLFDGYVRNLSPLEAWRLMGISDQDYYKAKDANITKTQLLKQAGNAIVVDVLSAIFTELFKKSV